MRNNCKSITTSPEIVKHIEGLTKANNTILTKLIPWLAANEKIGRKFRNAVLVRLSNIESMLTEVQGCQLAQYSKTWPLKSLTDKEKANYFKELNERIVLRSETLGAASVKYIYGEDKAPEIRSDRRRSWWGWEI